MSLRMAAQAYATHEGGYDTTVSGVFWVRLAERGVRRRRRRGSWQMVVKRWLSLCGRSRVARGKKCWEEAEPESVMRRRRSRRRRTLLAFTASEQGVTAIRSSRFLGDGPPECVTSCTYLWRVGEAIDMLQQAQSHRRGPA